MYSRASGLVGVEMNSFFCELQCQVVSKYNMADRVRVVCSDICSQASLLQEADVIVLNNVFEFFCSPENQARLEKKTIRYSCVSRPPHHPVCDHMQCVYCQSSQPELGLRNGQLEGLGMWLCELIQYKVAEILACALNSSDRIWEFLYTTVRKHGTLIVTIPSIQESWQHIPFKVRGTIHP